MTTNFAFTPVAESYADAVRVLFAPAGKPISERGERGPASSDELVVQAQRLVPLAGQFNAAAATQLEIADPELRQQVELSLLAKALTDLDISEYLLQAALDADVGIERTAARSAERGGAVNDALERQLDLLVHGPESGRQPVERDLRALENVEAGREALLITIEDTLRLIAKRAGATAKTAMTGLAGLGVAEVAQAAGTIGMGVAGLLGQAEQMTRLYGLVRDFALKAYEALWALLGPQLAQIVGQQVSEWLNKWQESEQFEALVSDLYAITRPSGH